MQAQDRFEAAFGRKKAEDLRKTLDLIAALDFGSTGSVPANPDHAADL